MAIIGRLSSRLSFRYKLFKYALPYRWYALRCKALEMSYPDYLEKIQKMDISPIFIVGAGRSGNTLLARLLHETGAVHFGPENFTLHDTYLAYLQCIKKPWKERVDRILGILIHQEDAWRWEKVDVDAVRESLLASREQTLGNIIHAWYLHYGRAIGYPSERWGCKTPNLTPFISYFMKIFPNASIIQVLRSPTHVMVSFGKAGIVPYDDEMMAYVHWTYFNDSLEGLQGKQVVKFAEMTANPQGMIQALKQALGIRSFSVHVPFDNPDMNYRHLANVNSKITPQDNKELHQRHDLSAIAQRLEKRYESS